MRSLGNYDVVIVGAGPVGAVAARSAARHGARVLLVERGETPTYPNRCTGIISPRCLKESELGHEVVLREIKGGRIHAPNGRLLQIEAKDTRAVVIDRCLFNFKLLEMAKEAGTEFITKSRVTGLDNQWVMVERGGCLYRAQTKVIIGADGAKSQVANWAKLPPPGQFLLGLQATSRYEPERPDFIEVFFDQNLAPGFFAWVVPAEEGIARVGLATNRMKHASALLKRLLQKLNLKPMKVNAGLIPIGPRTRTTTDRVMVVGDAAAQAKPTSGGGLFTGIVAAKIAGQVAADCVLTHYSNVALTTYETRWREKLGRELSIGMSLRRLFGHLRNNEFNFIFTILDNKTIRDVISTHGDIDYPSLIIKALFQQPKQWRKIWKGLNGKLASASPPLKPAI